MYKETVLPRPLLAPLLRLCGQGEYASRGRGLLGRLAQVAVISRRARLGQGGAGLPAALLRGCAWRRQLAGLVLLQQLFEGEIFVCFGDRCGIVDVRS